MKYTILAGALLAPLMSAAALTNPEKQHQAGAAAWADSVYNTLSERERVAQLVFGTVNPTEGDASKAVVRRFVKNDDCGGLLAYNYFSGEHVTGFNEGRPLFVRTPSDKFNLANFMKVTLYTAFGALKTGLDILLKEEDVKIDSIFGHGGLFTTKGVCQKILAAAMNAPVSVMDTASEGGAWGMAILASYMNNKKDGESLEDYLKANVFAGTTGSVEQPAPADVKGFDDFIKKYSRGLAIERAAVENL